MLLVCFQTCFLPTEIRTGVWYQSQRINKALFWTFISNLLAFHKKYRIQMLEHKHTASKKVKKVQIRSISQRSWIISQLGEEQVFLLGKKHVGQSTSKLRFSWCCVRVRSTKREELHRAASPQRNGLTAANSNLYENDQRYRVWFFNHFGPFAANIWLFSLTGKYLVQHQMTFIGSMVTQHQSVHNNDQRGRCARGCESRHSSHLQAMKSHMEDLNPSATTQGQKGFLWSHFRAIMFDHLKKIFEIGKIMIENLKLDFEKQKLYSK